MATKQQVLKRAAELGATIEDDGFAVDALAPAGQKFAATEVHVASASYEKGTKAEAWGLLLYDMSLGLFECEDPTCSCRGGSDSTSTEISG